MGEGMTDILIVEDNVEIGTLLCDFLTAEGYSVTLCVKGEEGLSFLDQEQVKLVVLDIMLPGMDGFAVCRKIREKDNTPIFIVSAKVDKESKLNGLLLGADDYIEKPYDIDLLIAKIDGIFTRRYETKVLQDQGLKLDLMNRKAYVQDQELTLTAKEYDLLQLFLENKGKVLKKEWIFNKIWGFDSFSELQTLTVHIKWLRQKIEQDSKNPTHILTVWGIGYRYE